MRLVIDSSSALSIDCLISLLSRGLSAGFCILLRCNTSLASPLDCDCLFSICFFSYQGSDDDDDYVLSHSSLCSRDSDDEELKCGSGEEDFSSVSCREDEIESMMSENIKEFTSYEAGRLSTDAPSAIDGLMSGPLLLNQTSGNESTALPTDTHDSVGALGCGRNNTVAVSVFRNPTIPLMGRNR